MTVSGGADHEADGGPLRPPAGVPRVRAAVDADLTAIHAIYAHHVHNGTGSFEETAPTPADMIERRAGILARGLPYLVAECGGEVSGFAYAAPFRLRSAYRYIVEDSIYIHPDARGHGIGGVLLATLIEACTGLGYRQMIAVIGDSANAASIGLHARFGFVEAGRLVAAGYKFGRWLDVVFMQLALTPSRPA